MAALLVAMGAILVGYYFWPPFARAISAYGEWQAAGGVLRTGLVAGFAGGVISELSVIYFRDGDRWKLRHVEDMIFRFVLFFLGGMIVAVFYDYQAFWFGQGHSLGTLAPKVLVDQFVFSVLWSTPYYALAFRWQGVRYSPARLWSEMKPAFLFERMLPVLITNWMFWIPGVTIIYSMPLPLEMPLNIFGTAIWGVLLAALAKKGEPETMPVPLRETPVVVPQSAE